MEKKNIYFLIFILVALLATGIVVYFSENLFVPETQVPEQLKPLLLYKDLDKKTIACLDKVPIKEDPLTGSYRVDRLDSYTELYYLGLLNSVEKEKINDCDFIKLEMRHSEFELYFSLYIPENLPSPGTEKNTMPFEMSGFTGKTVNIKIRYGTDPSSKNPENVKNILGWQFIFSTP